MGYEIPAGYSRIVFEYDAVSTAGSAPCWGVTANYIPSGVAANLLATWAGDALKDETSNDYLITRVTMRNNLQYAEQPISAVGGRVGQGQPPQVSTLVTLATGLTGRANRGRVYMPGLLADSDVDGGGNITEPRMEDLRALWSSFTELLGAEDVELYIGHSTELAPTPVSSSRVENVAATQRRRLRR